MLMLSSAVHYFVNGPEQIKEVEFSPRTILLVCAINIHVEFFISLESLLQQRDLLSAFHFSGRGIGTAFLVAFHLIQLNHFFDSLEILLFNVQLELDLRKHQLNARAKMRGIVFNQIWQEQELADGLSIVLRGFKISRVKNYQHRGAAVPSFVKFGRVFGTEPGPGVANGPRGGIKSPPPI